MPNIITHKLFAQRVMEQCQKQDIKRLIERHPQIFYIGSNGPDFLFFSHSKPWESYKSHTLNHLGSAMHATQINAFYEVALRCIQEQTKADIKELMLVYLFGHLCHWALDKTTHPYIFYRTGDCKGASAGLHHRFESMMDTMMLDRFYHMSIKDFRSYEICEYDEDILKAISRIYVPVAKEVYHVEVKVHDVRESLNSWYDIQKMLYDPNQVKYKVLKGIEGVIRKPWMISGNVVKAVIDEQYDVLNDQKQEWLHPCDDTIRSNASFMELFEEAIVTATSVIEKAYGCVEYGADVTSVLHILNNQAYDTGMSTDCEMKYFNSIYDEA